MVLRYLLLALGFVAMITGCNNLVSLTVGDETVTVVAGEEIWTWGSNVLLLVGGLALAAVPEALRFRRERRQRNATSDNPK